MWLPNTLGYRDTRKPIPDELLVVATVENVDSVYEDSRGKWLSVKRLFLGGVLFALPWL